MYVESNSSKLECMYEQLSGVESGIEVPVIEPRTEQFSDVTAKLIMNISCHLHIRGWVK